MHDFDSQGPHLYWAQNADAGLGLHNYGQEQGGMERMESICVEYVFQFVLILLVKSYSWSILLRL
jgi:hypothetical protein